MGRKLLKEMLVALNKKSLSFQNFIRRNGEATNVMGILGSILLQTQASHLSISCFVMENIHFSDPPYFLSSIRKNNDNNSKNHRF